MLPVIEILLAGIGFGFIGLLAKTAFAAGLSVGQLLAFRFTVAAVVLWTIELLVNGRAKLWRVTLTQFLISASLGLFGYACHSTLYFLAIRGVSVSLAALLLFTYPAIVPLLASVLISERLTRRQVFLTSTTMAGLVIFLWNDPQVRDWLSVLYGLLAALAYSLYIILSRRFQKNIHPRSSALYVITFAAIGLSLIHHVNPASIVTLEFKTMLVVLALAVVCTIVPIVLFLSGLQKVTSAQASVLTTIEPITAALLSAVVLHEHFGFGQVIGAGLILFAMVASSLSRAGARLAT